MNSGLEPKWYFKIVVNDILGMMNLNLRKLNFIILKL